MAVAMLSGFAVRANGSCLSTEVDCGQTMKPYHACCPAGSYCPAQYNVACCPSSANCTETLLQSPSCANTTWNLYDNSGYFCCEPGKIGYASPKSFSDGCADPGVPPDGAVLLSVVSVGQAATLSSVFSAVPSTSSSSSTTIASVFSTVSSSIVSSSTTTTSYIASADPPTSAALTTTTFSIASAAPAASAAPTVSADTTASGHSNTGAIAGGVVGAAAFVAVLGIAFWFLRHKKNKAQDTRRTFTGGVHEKDATGSAPIVHEADGGVYHESILPTSMRKARPTKKTNMRPVELP